MVFRARIFRSNALVIVIFLVALPLLVYWPYSGRAGVYIPPPPSTNNFTGTTTYAVSYGICTAHHLAPSNSSGGNGISVTCVPNYTSGLLQVPLSPITAFSIWLGSFLVIALIMNLAYLLFFSRRRK